MDDDSAHRAASRSRSDPHHPASWATVRNARDLGRFLTRVRVARGWTQKDLALHLGFPVRYLHEIESGKETLAYSRLFALLRTLHLDVQLSTPDAPDPTAGPPSDIEDWDF